ncbi:hypothetical protein Taro_031601, partial [Colocasia esculenta]|nr:hypothetical protein [Colocasia esculenta]
MANPVWQRVGVVWRKARTSEEEEKGWEPELHPLHPLLHLERRHLLDLHKAEVWTKTLVAEGEAIIGEAQEVPVPEAEAEAEVRAEDPVAEAPVAPVVLEEAAVVVMPEEPVAILDIVASIQGEQEEVVLEVVALGHSNVQVEDAPAQGEHVAEMAADVQGEPQLAPMLISFKKVLWRAPRMKMKFLLIMWSQLLAPMIKGQVMQKKKSGHQGQIGVEDSGPSGPKVVEESSQDQPAQDACGPPGPSVEQAGPPGPVVDASGPSGPVESQDEHRRVEAPVEEVMPPEPPTSPLQTLATPSPPSSTTAPPAPATFKQPLPKNIFSPTPFPTTTSYSPVSSTFIPPPPSEAPPTSSSAGASSSGPSSAGPSVPPPSTSYSFLHPPTPPSFVTIILEGAQLEGPFIQNIKDEFEVAILRSV